MRFNVIYLFLLLLASPVIVYRSWKHGRYRRGIREKLFGVSANHPAGHSMQGEDDCLWVHAVSVGEVNLVRPLVDHLRAERQGTRVVVSTSTDAGFDLAVSHHGADRVFFCPLDFTWAVSQTLRTLKPKELILAELELWPNLIRRAGDVGVEVTVVNARLSEKSAAGYQKFGLLTRPTFERLHRVLCQDDVTADRFRQCGTPIDRVSTTGSLKFDNAPKSRECTEVQTLAHWAGVSPWHRVWIVGSTQSGEETMALEIYRQLREHFPELRLVIVPRHPERFAEVGEQIQASGLELRRRSMSDAAFTRWDSDQVLLVDTIGELRFWWGVGHFAFVGGSMGDRGGQNMLEPAGYGCAVAFGPNTKNFREISRRLILGDGAVRVDDAGELEAFIRRCLEDPPAADELGRNARKVVDQHRGAMRRTLQQLQVAVQDAQRFDVQPQRVA
ncbi:MAG: 3-deoxy-D-manno-octulosonic acid transferase [Planctomycetota bacterium]